MSAYFASDLDNQTITLMRSLFPFKGNPLAVLGVGAQASCTIILSDEEIWWTKGRSLLKKIARVETGWRRNTPTLDIYFPKNSEGQPQWRIGHLELGYQTSIIAKSDFQDFAALFRSITEEAEKQRTTTLGRRRVYELARDWGLSKQDLVTWINKSGLGVPPVNQMSWLNEADHAKIRQAISNQADEFAGPSKGNEADSLILQLLEHKVESNSFWFRVKQSDQKDLNNEVEWHTKFLLSECLAKLGISDTNVKLEGDAELLRLFCKQATMNLKIQD